MTCGNQTAVGRTVYFDYLRVFAAFSVVILHTAAHKWKYVDINGWDWKVFNFYDGMVRWSVPVFVMISGALFLDKDIPVKTIYTKYILRLFIAFAAWSGFYMLFAEGIVDTLLRQLLGGHYHMWFIPMIIGLYMCIPLLKCIVKEERNMKYFLALAFGFGVLLPSGIALAKDFGNGVVLLLADVAKQHADNVGMQMVLGYSGYFVLGYYLSKIRLTRSCRILIYLLGAFGFAATVCLNQTYSQIQQTASAKYFDNLSVNVFFEALAVFVWFQYREYRNVRIHGLVRKLSEYSFGVYLLHVFLLEQLSKSFGIDTLDFSAVLSVPAIGVLVFIASMAISAILNQIPVIKKYVV